jgi:hypothetical protein
MKYINASCEQTSEFFNVKSRGVCYRCRLKGYVPNPVVQNLPTEVSSHTAIQPIQCYLRNSKPNILPSHGPHESSLTECR